MKGKIVLILLPILVVYLCAGAALFRFIESPVEEQIEEHVRNQIRQFLGQFGTISINELSHGFLWDRVEYGPGWLHFQAARKYMGSTATYGLISQDQDLLMIKNRAHFEMYSMSIWMTISLILCNKWYACMIAGGH